ncbi:MAG: sulfotransferase domain-containing protein [Marinomonas sp.]
MKVAIIGMPKTGTTALYESVKVELPLNTVTSFEPKSEAELTYLLNEKKDNALTKIMFTRLDDVGFDVKDFDRTIVIVRDPRDYLVSSLLYKFDDPNICKNKEKLAQLKSLFEQKQLDPTAISFTDLFSSFSSVEVNWDSHLKLYIKLIDFIKHNNVFVLKYEDFADDKLNSLSEYLGLNVKNKRELEGWTAKIQRKGTSGDWKNWFTKDDLYLKNVFSDVMVALGYTNWEVADSPVIEKKYSTDYINKLVTANASDPTKSQEITPEYIENLFSAAKDNKVIPLTRLALLKLEGKSVEYDLFGAFLMFKKAASMGSPRAQRELGKIILENCTDNLKALGEGADYYFGLAVEQDDPESCYHLGEMFMTNKFIKSDHDESFRLFLKGAKLGSKSCMRKVAHFYANGISVEVDLEQSEYWLAKRNKT